MLSDNGGCRGPGKEFFSRCFARDVHIDCGAECKSLGPCLAFNVKEESGSCSLITTSEPENGCPNGFQWVDNGLLATSVEDFEFSSAANFACYAKKNENENERR